MGDATMAGTDAAHRSGFDDAVLRTALGLAARAPSIHNSQPWRWRIGPYGVDLCSDATRRLPGTDPHGRDQVISCGAALHHLLVALAAAGVGARVYRVPDREATHHLATVSPAAHVDVDVDAELAAAIDRRCTDRRPFRSWPVPPELTGELAAIAEGQGVGVDVVTDPRRRWQLYRAIDVAARQQEADPRCVEELAAWSGLGAGVCDGVPADRAPCPDTAPGQMPMRSFAGRGTPIAPSDEPESAVLMLLSTSTDTHVEWLRVGEVTSAILLRATLRGLAASPLTQPLEIGETRAFVRGHLTGRRSAHPQMLLRIGWPRDGALHPTPRRPLTETVDR